MRQYQYRHWLAMFNDLRNTVKTYVGRLNAAQTYADAYNSMVHAMAKVTSAIKANV